jgi:hypothetical protein
LLLFRRSILAVVSVVLVVSCTDIDTEQVRETEPISQTGTSTVSEQAFMTEQLYRAQAARQYKVAAWKDAFAVHAKAAAARAEERAEEASRQRRKVDRAIDDRNSGPVDTSAPSVQIGTGISRTAEEQAFLDCTRGHESDTSGGYQAVNPSGKYRGAYQFDQNTWDSVTSRHNPALVGSDPAAASSADQDEMATELYRERGNQPWGGRC